MRALQKMLFRLVNQVIALVVRIFLPVRGLFVFASCAATVAVSFALAFLLRFDFSVPPEELASFYATLPVLLAVKLVAFYIFRIYGGLWRYVSIADLLKLFWANFIATAVMMAAVGFWHSGYFSGLSRSVLVLDFLICFFAMSGKRLIARIVRECADGPDERSIVTLVVGDPAAANALIHAFSLNPGKRHIVGVLCARIEKGRSVRGVPVVGTPEEAGACAKRLEASEILLLPPYSTPANIRMIIEQLELERVNCALRMVPAYTDIADGSINVSHIKEVEIEDLLGRKPVRLDNSKVSEFLRGRRVMVTGAGGSIGSELCRQIAAYNPGCLALYELTEFNLYSISMELGNQFPKLKLVNVIGDVRCAADVERVLRENRVDVVYHAAAFKHVPLMEENPHMALSANLLGSATVAAACEAAGVERMVMISSDKAVGPTSVMGATKRLAERVLLERPQGPTQFVAVRFGNVLGSSGSVIPLFKQQIKDGGPITVTSANVTRFFMSIPEAVDLVLQAGAIGQDRDIMVLEMGQPVRIMDMARKLVELSGLRPDIDIEIKVTGMRPGEKEYEELLTGEEKADRTSYDRIFVARKTEAKLPPVDLDRAQALVDNPDEAALRQFIKEQIPDHKLA